jgi:hypothetical protein
MSSADWFAKKLGGGAPARTYTPPTAPAYNQPSYPQGPPPPAYVPPVPQGQQPKVTAENIAQVAGLWKGGEATRKETSTCPNCGGNAYFSMTNANGSKVATQHGMASAAPRCFECGYTTHHGLQTGAMG